MRKAAIASTTCTAPNRFFRAPRTQELLRLLEQEAAQNLGGGPTPNWGNAPSNSVTPNWRNAPDTITPNWRNAPVVKNVGGSVEETGTYVCIELVIAYGQFVSAAFDLKVIRTFLAVQHAEHAMPHIQARKFWDLLRPHWAGIAALALAGWRNKAIAAQVGRSAGSVGRCLRRMYEVGYCNPVAVFKARLSPATAARWAIEKPVAARWGLPPVPAAQGEFDFAAAGAA